MKKPLHSKDDGSHGPKVDLRVQLNMQKALEIMSSPKESEKFFFGALRPFAEGLAKEYSGNNYDINASDICAIIYLALWENNWSKLRAYKGECSMNQWAQKIGKQAVIQRLIEEHQMKAPKPTKPSDFRLKILSIAERETRSSIVEMADDPELIPVLRLYYVEKAPKADFEDYCGGPENARKLLKRAQNHLKERLLYTENPFDFALVAEDAEDPEIAWSDGFDREGEDNQENLRTLALIIGYSIDDPDHEVRFEEFLREFIVRNAKWNATERHVWFERFVHDADPVILGEEIGHTRGYVDNLFSKCHREFKTLIRKWSKAQGLNDSKREH